jgi:hypothetical protein
MNLIQSLLHGAVVGLGASLRQLVGAVHVLVGVGAEYIGPCLDRAGSCWWWTCGDQGSGGV